MALLYRVSSFSCEHGVRKDISREGPETVADQTSHISIISTIDLLSVLFFLLFLLLLSFYSFIVFFFGKELDFELDCYHSRYRQRTMDLGCLLS